MISRIPAGKHRSRPWRPALWWNKTTFTWVVKFDESCRYDLGNDDQYDTNKLCGVGYLWHHHRNSARFGWRYNTTTQFIELVAYCYVNGKRVVQPICQCVIGRPYRIELRKLAMMYLFTCQDATDWYSRLQGTAEVPYDHKKVVGYRLGVFFGGNRVAPHEMKIEIKRG